MSERMTDERLTSLIKQRGLFPSWFDLIVLELLRAVEAERAEVERLKAQSRALTTVLEGEREKLLAVREALTDHIADLRRTADVLADWQDPAVGPFAATIKEIRKSANELEALLKGGE